MGFILPFALVFVAIPLETFVHSLRTVLGLSGIGLLRALALILRVTGSGMRQLGVLAEKVYDLPLFVPLWIEAKVLEWRTVGQQPNAATAAEEASWQEAQS
jgi:hypothetical protein